MEIQQLLLDESLKFISGFIKKAKITIAGVEEEFDIHSTKIDGNKLSKRVYLTSETGLITTAKLIDGQGRDIHVKSINIIKGGKGFMVVFQIELKIEGA